MGRFWRAIQRIRRGFRARLRWKPNPQTEPPQTFPGVTASPKLRVFTPGLVRGRIHRGGG